jgi:hypothetical protein
MSTNYGSVPTSEGGGGGSEMSTKDRAMVSVKVIIPITVVSCFILYAPWWSTLTMATICVYVHAAFELLSGVMFIADPGALHNGWSPSPGLNTYLADSGGIAYLFWGILLILKVSDPTVLVLNFAFCVTWLLYLGSHLLEMPWRAKSDVGDGSWAVVPVVVKGVCGVASLIAASEVRV